MKTWLMTLAGLAALPALAVTNTLLSISPNTAQQGATAVVVTFTLNPTPPAPGIAVPIQSAMIGGIAGTNLSRPTTTTVTGTFNIPAEFKGASLIAIRLDGPGGWHSYNWFWNYTASVP